MSGVEWSLVRWLGRLCLVGFCHLVRCYFLRAGGPRLRARGSASPQSGHVFQDS